MYKEGRRYTEVRSYEGRFYKEGKSHEVITVIYDLLQVGASCFLAPPPHSFFHCLMTS